MNSVKALDFLSELMSALKTISNDAEDPITIEIMFENVCSVEPSEPGFCDEYKQAYEKYHELYEQMNTVITGQAKKVFTDLLDELSKMNFICTRTVYRNALREGFRMAKFFSQV